MDTKLGTFSTSVLKNFSFHFVCSSTGLHKNYSNIHMVWWKDGMRAKEEPIRSSPKYLWGIAEAKYSWTERPS